MHTYMQQNFVVQYFQQCILKDFGVVYAGIKYLDIMIYSFATWLYISMTKTWCHFTYIYSIPIRLSTCMDSIPSWA